MRTLEVWRGGGGGGGGGGEKGGSKGKSQKSEREKVEMRMKYCEKVRA